MTRRWPVGLSVMNSLFALIAVVSLLPSARADLASFSVMLALTLLLVTTLATASRTIAVSPAEAGRTRFACTLGLVVGAIGLVAASLHLEVEPPVLAAGLGRAGVEVLFWTAAAWLVRLGGTSHPASTRQDPPARRRLRAGSTEALAALTALILMLAGAEAALSLESWPQLFVVLLAGRGIYMILLAVACLVSCAGGFVLERRGLGRLEPPVTNIARDRQTIERWGGRVLAACGLGVSLVCLQAAQTALASASTPAPVAAGAVSPTVGPFELLTWLGTLGTLVVVIAGALVAMYVKRRDDDSQHSAAVTTMRQQWIDRSRLLLSELLALGERMRTRMDADDFDADLAGQTLMRLRAFELQLNPVEPMPRVLLSALRSWLHEAGLHEHGRDQPTKRPTSIQDFEVTTDWLVGLGQLVLKTEWAVTSVGRDRVPEKLWHTWHSLIAYETKHRPELERIAKSAVSMRERNAASIASLLG